MRIVGFKGTPRLAQLWVQEKTVRRQGFPDARWKRCTHARAAELCRAPVGQDNRRTQESTPPGKRESEREREREKRARAVTASHPL